MNSIKKTLALACAASVLSFGVAVAQTPPPAADAPPAPAADAPAAPAAAADPMKKPMKKPMKMKKMSKKKMMKKKAM